MTYDENALRKRQEAEEEILNLVEDESLREELKRKFALLRDSSPVASEPRSWEPTSSPDKHKP